MVNPLDLVNLGELMRRTTGNPEIKIGLIDGPVAIDHPDLASENIRPVSGALSGACSMANSFACRHGTFVAGILSAKRGSAAPAICPDCTLLVRPIFTETKAANGEMPGATPEALIACLRDAYDKAPFVHVRPPEEVQLKAVVGTNHALVGVKADKDVVVVVSTIDNLMKGAAGQAIQNLNLQLGLSEKRGLESLQRISP